ncbi:MAG TPA: polysaccharide deacetylase family protein, partial [Bacteroidales bacterium]
IEYQKKYKLKPLYFILFGHYSRFDKNLSIRNLHFRKLIKRLGDYASIGIHPSYNSNDDPRLFAVEIKNLSNVIKKEITSSRQHFLRLTFPETYRNLIDQDITDDYTMGYALLPGFRAGICNSYNFFDLDMEIETHLRLHPFAVMDGTLKDYMELSPEQAIETIRKLIEAVKAVDGTFISLWHNESLSNEKRWAGWLEVYEKMLEMAVEPAKESKI